MDSKIKDFLNEIKLIDKEEFYQMHADFLSRLAMTFTHGDYARIEEIKEKENIAEGMDRLEEYLKTRDG